MHIINLEIYMHMIIIKYGIYLMGPFLQISALRIEDTESYNVLDHFRPMLVSAIKVIQTNVKLRY